MKTLNTLSLSSSTATLLAAFALASGLTGCIAPPSSLFTDLNMDELGETMDLSGTESPAATTEALPSLPQTEPVYFTDRATVDTAVGSGNYGNSSPSTTLTFDDHTTMWVMNNSGGYSGDMGRAKAAQLNWPTGVAVNRKGSIFVADMENGVVRCVNSAGTIETCIGARDRRQNGTSPFVALPLSWPAGLAFGPGEQLFIIDADYNHLYRVDPMGHRRVVARGFYHPTGVAVDKVGNVYVAGFYDDSVYKIPAEVALSPYPEYSVNTAVEKLDVDVNGPGAVAVDDRGDLYITDNGHHRILRRDSRTGEVTVVAGTGTPGYAGDGGPATEANLHFPTGLAVSPSGHVFFTDMLNNAVRVITPEGTLYTVTGTLELAGGLGDYAGDNGSAIYGELNNPYDVELDNDGNLLIADANNNRIRKITFPADIREELLEKL